MNKNEVKLHGECFITIGEIPLKAKKRKINKKDRYIIIADSETTGNHHVVDIVDGAEFYDGENGSIFMNTPVETTIRCVDVARHSTQVLPAGTYEFGTMVEFDPFTERLNKVRD